MRVLSFESRRAREIEKLLQAQGFDPFVAPALREIPMEENPQAFEFGRRLLAGDFDLVVCLTGVGFRYLLQVLESRFDAAELRNALSKITIVARGPKPAAALREVGLTPTFVAPDPGTWHEVLAILNNCPERRVAVQEYGRREQHLLDGMIALGMEVMPVPVYQWALPLDTAPLQRAIAGLLTNEFQWVIFTTSVQVDHLLQVAPDRGAIIHALQQTKVASIGQTTSATLRNAGIEPTFVPSRPRMGLMIQELKQLS